MSRNKKPARRYIKFSFNYPRSRDRLAEAELFNVHYLVCVGQAIAVYLIYSYLFRILPSVHATAILFFVENLPSNLPPGDTIVRNCEVCLKVKTVYRVRNKNYIVDKLQFQPQKPEDGQ